MSNELNQLLNAGQQALSQQDWPTVEQVNAQLQKNFSNIANAHYFSGLASRVKSQVPEALESFKQALKLDPQRYDIGVELANMYSISRQNGLAAKLLEQYVPKLHDSPRFLDLAGTIYTEIGLSELALPLFKRACELQPDAQIFKANLATCAIFLGDIELGEKLYKELLALNPDHRKNHYQLSRLKKAKDTEHLEQMLDVIKGSTDTKRDIPILFALGKEYEDLGEWDSSFEFYKKACDGVRTQTGYKVQDDVGLIDAVIECYGADYLSKHPAVSSKAQDNDHKMRATPIFVLGLPRTGTTLVERIISSHYDVSSVGETTFLQTAIRKAAGLSSGMSINADVMRAVAEEDPRLVAEGYMQRIDYRLGEEGFFIEKLPFNFPFTGLIAAAWPQARIVHLVRYPMDACFSMYKQVFTWAYHFSYSLEDLGNYYIAYNRLRQHWKQVLGDRFVEVSYEALVSDQEAQTRQLLDALDLPFDEACLSFEKNTAPSTTASSVQVRSKVHKGSVGKWERYQAQLAPLEKILMDAGIDLDSYKA